VLPWDQDALEDLDNELEDDAQQRAHHQTDVHRRDGKRLPRVPDEIAQPAFGADELGGDAHEQSDGQRELEAGQDAGHRAGDGDGAEKLPAIGAEVLADVEIDLIDGDHAGHGVDEHQKNDADGHADVFGFFAEAENQEDQGQYGDFWNGEERGDDWFE